MPKAKKLEKETFPGEKLSVIEEYSDGPGTYQEDGDVRSSTIGTTTIDNARRELVVKKTTPMIIYGVIYGFCSRCGGLLEKKEGKLICPDCGRMERRKTASTYGKEQLV